MMLQIIKCLLLILNHIFLKITFFFFLVLLYIYMYVYLYVYILVNTKNVHANRLGIFCQSSCVLISETSITIRLLRNKRHDDGGHVLCLLELNIIILFVSRFLNILNILHSFFFFFYIIYYCIEYIFNIYSIFIH